MREYAAVYTDRSGQHHRATARFYLPWWLNKMHDSGFVDDFDLANLGLIDKGISENQE